MQRQHLLSRTQILKHEVHIKKLIEFNIQPDVHINKHMDLIYSLKPREGSNKSRNISTNDMLKKYNILNIKK